MTTVSTVTTTIFLEADILDAEKPQAVPLETVKYTDLLEKDALEISQLLRSCQSPGFFYLDVSGTSSYFNGDAYLDNIRSLSQQQEEYFSLPFHAKMKDYLEFSAERGYQYSPDSETFDVPFSSFHENDLPFPLDGLSIYYMLAHTHAIATTLIRSLSPFIGNEDGRKHITSMHDANDVSQSGLKLENFQDVEKARKGYSHSTGGTDGGSISLRYCEEAMIEYLDAETGGWAYIEPRRDCLIVNVGDLLCAASQGQFQGPLHRMGHPVVGIQDRRCLTYHLWPADGGGWHGR
ncbi:Oxidoreductase vrtI [Penicillium rolfsii]|nr:Oxidoreductase vrtI [Penicillium rolfsii]